MARAPRIEVADGVYHVVARGNERRAVFRDARDRERFLSLLGQVVGRHRFRVLCYCLMGNHYHLLVATPDANLARGMRHLNGVYAQWFNHRHRRVGHLFQGRYKAVLVQRDKHLLRAVRYIVRNPLRARIGTRVDEWPWTSHAATMGVAPAGVVAVAEMLSYLGQDTATARARYLALVADASQPKAATHPVLDGDENFVRDHLALLRSSPEHPRETVREARPPLETLISNRHDAAAIHGAYRDHGYSMRQIATHLGCGVSTIHRRIRECETAAAPEPETS